MRIEGWTDGRTDLTKLIVFFFSQIFFECAIKHLHLIRLVNETMKREAFKYSKCFWTSQFERNLMNLPTRNPPFLSLVCLMLPESINPIVFGVCVSYTVFIIYFFLNINFNSEKLPTQFSIKFCY